MKTSFIRLALIATLIGVNGASAATPCAHPTPARQVLHVKRDDLKPGRILLGVDGSRVAVRRTLAPEPQSQPWHVRVDWKKHQTEPSHSPTTAVLHLDTDDKGVSYLCRIEIRGYTDAYVERNVGIETPAEVRPSDIEVIEQVQLTYDARQRLAVAVEAQRDATQRALKRTSTACFHYDAKDRFLGASFPDADSCAGFGPEQIRDRYVYQADGSLLRKISGGKSIPEPDGGRFVTDDARIVVFGPQGQPTAEYVTDDSGRHYRRSLAPKANDSQYHAIKVIGSPAALELRRLLDGKAPGFWQFHSIPSAIANSGDGRNETRYIVASGDIADINSQDRVEIWKALSRPDHDMVLEAQGIFLLVPEVSPALWEACMNPQLESREACS
ncbi:hypothetical protein ACSUZJ_05755 [Telluria sp. B2]